MMHRARPDTGSISAMIAVLTVAIVATAGLAFDGGRLLAEGRAGDDVAAEGARAAVDASVPPGPVSSVTIDPRAASAAAAAQVAAAGWALTGLTVDGPRVTVTVSRRLSMAILPLVGITGRTVSGQGTAVATWGVLEPGGTQ